jgi:hypothetical protein
MTRRVTYRTRGINELRGEAPDPSVDGDVVDPDSTLGRQRRSTNATDPRRA